MEAELSLFTFNKKIVLALCKKQHQWIFLRLMYMRSFQMLAKVEKVSQLLMVFWGLINYTQHSTVKSIECVVNYLHIHLSLNLLLKCKKGIVTKTDLSNKLMHF